MNSFYSPAKTPPKFAKNNLNNSNSYINGSKTPPKHYQMSY